MDHAYIDFAQTLADRAGEVIRPYFRTPVPVDIKDDCSPVTIADRAAEIALRDMVERTFPAHGFIGEELGSHNENAEFIWVVDPIDGTKSFITGKPLFGTLICLAHKGVPIIGIIDQPITQERWLGAKGTASTLNRKTIHTRPCSAPANAIISSTSPHLFDTKGTTLFKAVRSACKYIVYGSDCYAYGLLAAGFLDVVMESGLKPYDFCALAPIIEGAGGVITDWQGNALTLASSGNVLASGDPQLHTHVLNIIKDHD